MYFLQRFHITLIHVNGKTGNKLADGVSRSFDEMDEREKLNFTIDRDDDDFVLNISDSNPANSEVNDMHAVAQSPNKLLKSYTFVFDLPSTNNQYFYRDDVNAVETTGISQEACREVINQVCTHSVAAAATADIDRQTVAAVRRRKARRVQTPTDTAVNSDTVNGSNNDDATATGPSMSPVHATDCNDEPVCIELPRVSESDYTCDSEFCGMFNYLKSGELTDDDKINKTILLLADCFILENGLLFRVALPKNKKLQAAGIVERRLCLPLKYRANTLEIMHPK